MKSALLLIALALGINAQDVTDIAAIAKAASGNQTLLFTLTASDGTVCKLSKITGNTISAVWSCVSADGKQAMKPSTISSTTTTSSGMVLAMGAALCLVGLNPTASAVTMGSLGSVPAVGLTWNCTGDGLTMIKGTAVWP